MGWKRSNYPKKVNARATMGNTQNNIKKGIVHVFDEIQKTISVVGEKGFMQMLTDIREDSGLSYQNDIVKHVIKVVCKEFEIPTKELLYGTSRLADKTHALGVITLILVTKHDFKLKDCANFLNKNYTNLSRYKKTVEHYDPNHPLDLQRIEKLEAIKHHLKLSEQNG